MKYYWVFAFKDYFPYGGISDLIGIFKTWKEAYQCTDQSHFYELEDDCYTLKDEFYLAQEFDEFQIVNIKDSERVFCRTGFFKELCEMQKRKENQETFVSRTGWYIRDLSGDLKPAQA